MLAERPETDAAIAATSGQILTYAGKTADDVLLVVERRPHGERAGGLPERPADAVPRRRRRPLRRRVAVPRLDAHARRARASRRRSATPARSRRISIDAFPSGRVRSLVLDGSAGPEERAGRHRAHGARAALDLVHDRNRRHARQPPVPNGRAHARASAGARAAGAPQRHRPARRRWCCRARAARPGARSRRSRPAADGTRPVHAHARRDAALPALPGPDGNARRPRLGGSGLVLRRAATGFRGRLFPRAREAHRRAAARGQRRLDVDRPRGDGREGPLRADPAPARERRVPRALRR